jgi:hypothetical protein
MHNPSTSRGPWCRGLGLTVVLLGALLLPACSDDTPTDPGVGRTIFDIFVTPNPVIGVQNTLTGSVSAAYVITIRETGGLGGEIQFVNSTVFDPATGAQVAVNYFDSAALRVFVGTSRLEAESEIEITQTTDYSLQDLRVDADLTVAVQLLSDRGTLINQSILVPIVPSPAE